ncbi:MAG: VacJ family lipoprotein [Verrucomicrobiota bacterium]
MTEQHYLRPFQPIVVPLLPVQTNRPGIQINWQEDGYQSVAIRYRPIKPATKVTCLSFNPNDQPSPLPRRYRPADALKYFFRNNKKVGHLKVQPGNILCGFTLMLCGLFLAPSSRGQESIIGGAQPAATEAVVLPKSVPDPIEPFNRVMWSFNKGLMTGVIKPTSRVYRFVVVKSVRTKIGNFGKNLTYPGRLINNLLQGKWTGARDESYRFACNTTVGVAGIFDVAERWHIPKSDADFGQTFGQWGWQPACFIMLPIFGPSNERDTIGLAADTAANPLIYIAPYKLVVSNPLTYLGPYSYFTYSVMYNDFADTVRESVRFSQAETDPYSEIQYAWTFARKNRVANFQVKGKTDEASLETLESVFFTFKDPEFPDHGQTRSVLIPATGRKLPFTYWLQPGKAPVVYIVPGLGAHRLSQPSLALAELIYNQGFSAVCVSSAFNAEFMEHASTAAMPAYLPVDGRDIHGALTEIDRRLMALYPDRLGKKVMLGYSMGAYYSLFVAASTPTNQVPLIKFDRFVAINSPVRLLHGADKLDEFYRAPLDWPVAERANNIENTFLKVAELSKHKLTPYTSLPFSAIESKFLIGMTFRFTLRDVIFSSQQRHNQAVLQHPIRSLRRDPVYQEILAYSFQDYFEKFAIPYYQAQGLASPTAEVLKSANDLRTYDAALRGNPNIRLILNHNDFLLADEDLVWLHATFPPSQLTVFEQGGHLGNLNHPGVQQAILGALSGLKSAPSKSP